MEGVDFDGGSVCRICRTNEGRLHEPCRCAGSIAYAHQECLEQWLVVGRRKGTCELCGFQFRFRNVYRADAPAQAPWALILLQGVKTLFKCSLFLARLFVCGIIWFAVVPWLCLWSLRFAFWSGRWATESYVRWVGIISTFIDARVHGSSAPPLPSLVAPIVQNAASVVNATDATSPTIAKRVFTALEAVVTDPSCIYALVDEKCSTTRDVLAEIFLGQVVTVVGVVTFFAIFLLHEWVTQHAPLAEAPPQPARRNGRARHNLPAPQPPQPAPAMPDPPSPHLEPVVDDDGEDQAGFPPAPPQRPYHPRFEPTRLPPPMGTFETGEGERMPDYDDEEGMDELMSHIEAAEAMEASRRAEVEARQQVDMAPREADDEDAANIAAAIDPPEPLLMPRLVVPVDLPEEPPVEVANPAANAEGEEERDDLFLLDDIDGLLGAVGLRGPINGLFASAGLVLLLFSIISFAFIFGPYTIGRLGVASGVLQFYLTLPFAATRKLTDPLVDALIRSRKPVRLPPPPPPTILSRFVGLFRSAKPIVVKAPPTPPPSRFALALAPARAAYAGVSATVATGWRNMGTGDDMRDRLLCIALGYACVSLILAYVYKRPGTFGNRARDHIGRAALVVKTASFGFIEVFCFPFLCGLAVSSVMMPIFPDATFDSQLLFLWRAPMSAMYMYWAAGSLEMFVFAGWLSLCREKLRPGAMFFIRDPQDADTDPLHDFVGHSVPHQLRKLGKSLILYWTSIVLGIAPLPYLYRVILPGVFPLRWLPSASLSAIPYDLLAVQFLFPLLQFFFTALTNEAEALIQRTLRLLARFFCLSSFFFGTTSPSEERRGGGSVALVPHSDSFKVAAGVPAVRRTDPLGRPLTRAKAELIARESGHGYKVVYLPSCYRLRIAATMYTLWLLSTCVLTAIPASSIFLGRWSLAWLGVQGHVHDTYAFLIGLSAHVAYHCVRSIAMKWRPSLNVGQVGAKLKEALEVAWIYTRTISLIAFIVPVLLSTCIDCFLLNLLAETDSTPTLWLGYSWASGILYLSTLYRILLHFAPRTTWGARVILVNMTVMTTLNKQAMILAYTILLRPILLTLLGALARLLIPSLAISLIWQVNIRTVASWISLIQLTLTTWYATSGPRKALLEKFRDDAYLVERKLLDRDEA